MTYVSIAGREFEQFLRRNHFDANDTRLLTRQLEQIETQTYRKLFTPAKARLFIPLKQGVSRSADVLTYQMVEHVGQAKIVGNYADDLPRADVVGTEQSSNIVSIGASFAYSIQDLRRAADNGIPLEQERATAARDSMERLVDDMWSLGGPRMTGFLNHPNVPIVSSGGGAWSGRTSEQILADMNKLAQSVVDATRTAHIPDTLILNTGAYGRVATQLIGSNGDKTILETFLAKSPYIKNVEQWTRLDTAGAAGATRIVAYQKDSQVLEGLAPVDFEMMPPEPRNLAWTVACHGRAGGTIVRYPKAIAYMDGV